VKYISLIYIAYGKGKELTAEDGACGCWSWLVELELSLWVMKLVIKAVWGKGRKYIRYDADVDANAVVAAVVVVVVVVMVMVVVVVVIMKKEEEEGKGRRRTFYPTYMIGLGSKVRCEVLVNGILAASLLMY
jgi:hypothetical protein